MSRREPTGSVADRIEDVRKQTPPPKSRRARKGYISKDDFATLLGVGRAAVYNWTRASNPSYPEEPARKALAKASRGRYAPEDFERPRAPGTESLEHRVESLERVVERLERHIFGADAAPGQ